jgi:outer membrane receptor for ferrienterochelin and colicins
VIHSASPLRPNSPGARLPVAIAAAALAVVCGSRVARGDEPAKAPGGAGGEGGSGGKAIEVVVTGSRTNESASKAVVHVDTVTRDEAKRRGATNVGEALAGELGVEVNPGAYGAIGRPSAAQIGGLDQERVLVLQDGERVVGDVGGAIDLSELSLDGVDRIEFVQGPSSSLYGSSAMGGVIQVITGPPQREGWSGRFRLEGRYRWGGYASGELAYRKDDRWVSAEASFYGSQGVSLLPPTTTIPDAYRVGVGLRGGIALTPKSELMLKLRFGRDASEGVQVDDVPNLGRYFIDTPEVSNRFNVQAREKIELGEGHELVLSAAKQWYWNHSLNDRRDSPLDEDRERFHTMHSLEATGSFFQGKVVSFIAGGRAEVESFHQSLDKSIYTNGAIEHRFEEEVKPTTLGDGAFYTEVRTDPWPALSAVLGGRIEASPVYGAAAAPRVAIAVRPLKTLTIRASAGRGYRAPSAKEVGFVFDHSVYGYKVVGNPDLVPETSWGVHGDVEWRAMRGILLRASAYANWVNDLIDLRPHGSSGGVDEYTYVNVGAARTFGVEARLRASAGEWVMVEAGYSYLYTSDDEANLPLPGRPPHTVLLSARADTPIGLSFVGRLRGVTSAYVDETLDPSRSPGYVGIDVRVAKTLWKGFEAYAGATNLLGVTKNPLWSADERPVEGRTLYLGISAELPKEE